MKRFEHLLKGHKSLVFLDFEGTQYSHEMIALGAVICIIDKKGHIKKEKKALKLYVKAKNKIGKFVINLTGITEDTLQKKGISFKQAMLELKKYCGINFKKSSFITFGNHDMRILNMSIAHNLDIDTDICHQIQKNYIDFSAFIADYVKDDKNNPLSLVNYCKLFDVKEAGQAHDPAIDAINLAHLYDAFIRNKDLVLEQYLKVMGKSTHLPEPIAKAVKKLSNGEDVTAKEFIEHTKEYLD